MSITVPAPDGHRGERRMQITYSVHQQENLHNTLLSLKERERERDEVDDEER